MATGAATVDVLITVKDLVATRQRALELAIETVPNASSVAYTLQRAEAFTAFILEGKTEATK